MQMLVLVFILLVLPQQQGVAQTALDATHTIQQDSTQKSQQDSLRQKSNSRNDWDKLLEPYEDVDTLPKPKPKKLRTLPPPPIDTLHTAVGIYTGGLQSKHTGNVPLSDNGTICCLTQGGESTGILPYGGLVAFLPFLNTAFFSPRLGVESSGALLKTAAIEGWIRGKNNKIEKVVLEREMDVSLTILNADAVVLYPLLPPAEFYLGAGFSAGIPLAASYTARESILSPTSVYYYNGSRTTEIDKNTMNDVSSLNLALRAVVGSSFTLTGSVQLNLELQYHYALSNYSSALDVSWKNTMLMAHAALLWELK